VTESLSSLRVLVAAPRPVGLDPMPARSHIEAMYDALEAQGDRVEIHWLFPGTPEALAAALSGGDIPAPDVVLLDIAMAEGAAGGAGATTGPGPFARFESDAPEGRAVAAGALGAILRQGSVSLLVLRAPDSAGYAEALAREAELAVMRIDERLGEAAVRAAMTAALAALLAGHTSGDGVDEARRALRERGSGLDPEEGVTLHGSGDGPVVSPQAGGRGVGKVVRFPGTELCPSRLRLAEEPAVGGLPPEPELGTGEAGSLNQAEGVVSGWVGRATELLALERAAYGEAGEGPKAPRSSPAGDWAGNGITLIHGYHGAGKTALAAHAARWLVRTGRFRQVVYLRYAEGGYGELALHALGTRLVGDRFDLRSGEAVREVERALAETPTLIIWDDMDALLPEGAAPIAAADLEELLALGMRLAGIGGTRLWLLSQTVALPHPAYRGDVVALALPLGGMSPTDAEALARRVWPAGALDGADGDAARRLIWCLGGQPLALRALAPLLARSSPKDVAATLAGMMAGFDTGEARLRDQAVSLVLQALVRSLEGEGLVEHNVAHRRVARNAGQSAGPTEEIRPSLEALGVFAGGLMQPLGGNVTGLEDAAWDRIVRLLAAAGLARQLELPGFNVPFLRFHPALAPHLARRLSAALRSGALHRHAGAYLGLLKWMAQNAEQHGAVVRGLALHELANFRRGLGTLCEAHELNAASDYASAWQRFLVELGFHSEHQEATRRLREAVGQMAPAEGPLQRPGVRFLINQGEQLLASGRVTEAAAMLQHLVERMEAEKGVTYGGPEAVYDLAQARRRLGRSLVALGRADMAVSSLTAALAALSGAAGPEARQEAMLAQQDLGDAYLAGGRPTEAAESYGKGLEMARELDDPRLMGTLNAQLGTIAMARDDKDAARQHLETALFHLQTVDDAAGMAAVWSQLGTLAWHSTDLDEADRCYQQALELARQAQRPLVEAQVHLQLALTARQADRPGDAEAHYSHAIRLYQENMAQGNVRAGLASAEVALAELLLAEGEADKARVHAEAARVVAEDPRVPFDAWAVYALLQRIAEAQGDAERVAHWRAKTQESFAHSPEAQQVLQQWQGTITGVANAARGEALDAQTVELLEQLEERQEWHDLVGSIWRVLEGERGRELYAELDHVDALVVRRILEAIDAPPQEAESEGGEAEHWPVPLPQLMGAVVAGLRGDANARRLVAATLARMAREDAPESARRFATALTRILQGERDEAVLDGLPKEMADPLTTLLRALRQVKAGH
jgi:tetratricopeptide (TPR) repeat protein